MNQSQPADLMFGVQKENRSMLEDITLANSTFGEDIRLSMDIAVGVVFVIALISFAIIKANASTDKPDSAEDKAKTEPPAKRD